MLGGREEENVVKKQLYLYKKRYQTISVLRGAVYLTLSAATLLLLYASVEFTFRLGSGVRTFLFFSYFLAVFTGFIFWIAIPAYKWLRAEQYLSDEEAARQIGAYFPEIGDKFINLVQLEKATQFNSSLLAASIGQKRTAILPFNFTLAIDIEPVYKYLKVAAIPFSLIVLLLVLYPEFIQESTGRILQFQKEFKVPLPFNYKFKDKDFIGFRNEDYTFSVEYSGDKLPNESHILYAGEKLPLDKIDGSFNHMFKKPQSDIQFKLFAGGFIVDEYLVKIVDRPVLEALSIQVTPPAYLNQKISRIKGSGNIVVPEGSTVLWNLTCKHTDSSIMEFNSGSSSAMAAGNTISFKKTIIDDSRYGFKLYNQYTSAKDAISFEVTVVKDEMPQLSTEEFLDSTRFDLIFINGQISDDHGFSAFNLNYYINKLDGRVLSGKKPIRYSSKSLLQDFLFKFELQELGLQPGEVLKYTVELCDNDLVNGFKCVRSPEKRIIIPNKNDINKLVNESAKNLEAKAESILKKSQGLMKDIAATEKKLKSKPRLDWNDRKDISELLKKNKSLLTELEELKQIQQQLNEVEDKFLEFSPSLLEKIEQLNKLMNEVLDPETQKLLEELEKLLEESKQDDLIKKSLDKLKNKNETLNNELDRAMELYKNLQMDKKMEQAIEELKDLSLEQKNLSETNAKTEEIQDKQNTINEKFEEIGEKLKEIQEMNNDLEEKRTLGDIDTEKENIENDLKESSDQINAGKPKNAKKSQQAASDKMQELADKLQQAMEEESANRLEENIDDLKGILDNLLKLSFDLEELMKEFRVINQADPKYVALAQKQLKLSDDAKLIEDSLLSLSKRVFEIQSFVTREVSELRFQIDESTELIKQRKPGNASSRQQYSMTSANNLALLLDDVLKSMQEQMQMMNSSAKCNSPSSKGGKKPNPNGKPQPGDMGKMQQQLNDQLSKLKDKGKSGQGMSEELARMAAQQEMLRQALKELEKMMKDKGKMPGGGGFGDMESLMEEAEKDMVNRRITQETLLRQQEILTRLLEAENALKERDLSEEREGQKAKDTEDRIPPALKEYLKNKNKGTDYIKRVDPNLKPFYKNQVKEYLKNTSY